MKICVVSSSIFALPISGYGGLEYLAYHCAKGLAERGHKVTLIAPQGSSCPGCEVVQCLPPRCPEEMAYGGANLKDIQGRDIRWSGYWSKLLEFNDGGVIISHDWESWCVALKMEGRLKAPILKVCHAPINTMFSQEPAKEVSCVCISEDQKNHFEALFSPRKARVAWNGIDLDFYKPMETKRTDRFLFLARFSSIKGPDIAIEACKKAGVGLDLIGDTTITQEPQLFQKCKEMADGKQIRIIGNVPRGETVWWYSQAHCLLHPNERFREPFGLAPVEAMACGCPVVAWDYGAMRETIQPPYTGYLVDSFDSLVDRIKHISNGYIQDDSSIRVNCRKQAEKFSIQNFVTRYEELCEEALRKPW